MTTSSVLNLVVLSFLSKYNTQSDNDIKIMLQIYI